MTEDEVLALLDLLESRGVVAWLSAPDGGEGIALLVEADGFESVTSLLVARGMAIRAAELPERVTLEHDRIGVIELHPAAFDGDLTATRHRVDGSTVTIPGEAFVTAAYGSGQARQVRA